MDRDALGRTSTLTEGTFVVATGATGRVAIPPFVATLAGASARSSPLAVDVAPVTSSSPLVLVRSTLDAGAGRRADTLYVGQQVDYVVDVQLNELARQRLRRNPTFFPPGDAGGARVRSRAAGARRAPGTAVLRDAVVPARALPALPGTTIIPPATLTYSLPLSPSFFSREESVALRTDSVRFVAVEPPVQGRPADFAGAVGSLSASSRLDEPAGRMGDPVVLTLRLTGTGNVKLLPRPLVTVDWATIALGEERVSVDTSAARVRGAKEFDWLLTPRRAGRLPVPAIRYPYFDPERGAYDVARTDSGVFEVAAAALASADTGTATRLPIRRLLRAERAPPLTSRGWYWPLLVLAPAPATLRRVFARRRRRASIQSAARRLHGFGAARRAPSPRELRRTYLDALSERVPAVGANMPARAPLERLLRRAGVTEPTARAAQEVLDRLDRAAFSPSGVVDPTLVTRAVQLATRWTRRRCVRHARPVSRAARSSWSRRSR